MVVCITGGFGKLGTAFAKAFRAEGWQVLVTGRNIRDTEFDSFKHDVTSEEDTGALYDYIADKYGHLDLLINNAAVFHGGKVDVVTPADFLSSLTVNLYGPYLTTHYLLPLLSKAPSPMIINVSSTSGHRADPGSSAYNASKFGLMGFTESIRKELRKQNIRVTSLSPSSIYFGEPASEKRLNGSDIAQAAVFLAKSPASALYRDIEMWVTNP
jgi:3-oxoacyl-[acyl-carrier protein] reductase